MTPFELAEKILAEGRSETEHRAAASRAYMAVFQHLLFHRTLARFPATRSGEDHRLLIAYLKNRREEPYHTIGMRHLPRLRVIRNRADYDLARSFPRYLAEESVDRASEIIHVLLP